MYPSKCCSNYDIFCRKLPFERLKTLHKEYNVFWPMFPTAVAACEYLARLLNYINSNRTLTTLTGGAGGAPVGLLTTTIPLLGNIICWERLVACATPLPDAPCPHALPVNDLRVLQGKAFFFLEVARTPRSSSTCLRSVWRCWAKCVRGNWEANYLIKA